MTLTESFPTMPCLHLVLVEEPATSPRVVGVRGEQDISTAAALSVRLEQAMALDEGDLVVDMSGVTFLDASTIAVVVRAHRRLRRRSRSLTVRSPSTCVRRLFNLCGLSALFDPGTGRS